MAVQEHLVELSEKHRKLDLAIEQELQYPSSDTFRINELKKQKLRLKDEIRHLKKHLH